MTTTEYHTTDPDDFHRMMDAVKQETTPPSMPTGVFRDRTYQPWKNPVDRKNGAQSCKRSLRAWRRKHREAPD